MDALGYAPGPILYLVEVKDYINFFNIVAAKHRTYLAECDATELLRKFARKQALISIEKIKPYTDKYNLIVDYLETGDENLREEAQAAAQAAQAAAQAAQAKVWSSAMSSAMSAMSSAMSEVQSALSSTWAAQSANSANSASQSEANEMLTQMVREATGWEI